MNLKTTTLIAIIGQIIMFLYYQIFNYRYFHTKLSEAFGETAAHWINIIPSAVGTGSLLLFLITLYSKQQAATPNAENTQKPTDTAVKDANAPASGGAAGVLMILAGPASLGLTTTDPTNPSGLALLMMLLAFGGAAYSFARKRKGALVCTWIFVVVTGLSAIAGIVDSKWTGNALVYPIEFLICGGAACLLGFGALKNLRNAKPAA